MTASLLIDGTKFFEHPEKLNFQVEDSAYNNEIYVELGDVDVLWDLTTSTSARKLELQFQDPAGNVLGEVSMVLEVEFR